jgi:hypothetical protein
VQGVVPSQGTYDVVEVFQHGAPLQQSWLGEQDWPVSEQVGGGVQTQPVAEVQGTPFERQVVSSPAQHAWVGEQAWPEAEQLAAGISQVQPTSEAPQSCCAVPPVGITVQERPEQQLAAPVEVHCRPASRQAVTGVSQKPAPLHASPPQQGFEASHAWPESLHALWSGWQEPAVAPAGIWQANPAQQSAETVHAADCPWQARTHWRVSRSHCSEQHSAASAQVSPVPLQTGGTEQRWSAPHVPEQQSPSMVQVAPGETHATPPQRSTPSPSGTHGARLQHCSRNWQTSPSGLQQAGSAPSQPVGQEVPVPPPAGEP